MSLTILKFLSYIKIIIKNLMNLYQSLFKGLFITQFNDNFNFFIIQFTDYFANY